MQEFAERKRQIHLEQQERKELTKANRHQLSSSMSEGIMMSEGAKVEAAGRASFEKSVKIELASIRARQKKKAPPKKVVRKFGDRIKDDDELPPPRK